MWKRCIQFRFNMPILFDIFEKLRWMKLVVQECEYFKHHYISLKVFVSKAFQMPIHQNVCSKCQIFAYVMLKFYTKLTWVHIFDRISSINSIPKYLCTLKWIWVLTLSHHGHLLAKINRYSIRNHCKWRTTVSDYMKSVSKRPLK